jgi:hypothetical protein
MDVICISQTPCAYDCDDLGLLFQNCHENDEDGEQDGEDVL